MSGSLKRGLSSKPETPQEDTPGIFRTIESPKLNRRFSDDLSANLEMEDAEQFDKG